MPGQQCQIRGLEAFVSGFWKGQLWAPARVREIAEHFDYLRGYVRPIVRLGHDRSEALASSAGFPNCGVITDARVNERGVLILDLDGVPEPVGAAVNAGLFNSVSVDIDPPLRDPKNPARTLYPVLTGIALLGEERPEILGLAPIPKAVFSDGREVPPTKKPESWLLAMGITANPEVFGRHRPAIAFSAAARPLDCTAANAAASKLVTAFSSLAPKPKETPAMPVPHPKSDDLTKVLTACGWSLEDARALATSILAKAPTPAPGHSTLNGTGGSGADDVGAPGQRSSEPALAFSAASGEYTTRTGCRLTKTQLAILNSDVVRRQAPRVRARYGLTRG